MKQDKKQDKINTSFNLSSNTCPLIPPTSQSAILDSGCTGHYFPPHYPLNNPTPNTNEDALHVTLPDSSKIQSTHVAHLPIPTLDENATKTYIFPNLHSALISIGQLCDAECTVIFSKHCAKIMNQHNVLITEGTRDLTTGLWKINLPIQSHIPSTPIPSSLQANGIIKRDTPISDLCQFLHSSLFSPTISTLESAIKNGFLDSFPGLTLKTIRKYLPPCQATAKGHMAQEKKE